MKKISILFLFIFFVSSILHSQKMDYDETYGEQGLSLHQPKEGYDDPTSYSVLPNGKILIATTTGILRVNKDYSLDTSLNFKKKSQSFKNLCLFR